jgi:hypothetical protein
VAFVTALMVVLALAIPFTGVATATHGAGDPTVVQVTPETDSAVVGACNPFTVQAFGGNNNAQPAEDETIDIQATQSDTDTIADLRINFCDPNTGSQVSQTATPGTPGQLSNGAAAAGSDCDDNVGGGGNDNTANCSGAQVGTETPARINGECFTNSSGQCTFGVQSNEAGTMNITVFFETDGDNAQEAGEPFDTATKTWTGGGASAARNISCTPATDTNPEGSRHEFQCTVTDASGNALPGLTVQFDVTAGPNAEEQGVQTCPTTTNQQGSTPVANEPAGSETGTGTDECAYTDAGPNVATSPPGTDTITAFINQGQQPGQPAPTTGPDAGEPQTTIQKTWVGQGRTIDCEPETATNPVGTSHTITCTVRDAQGNAVPGVDVDFSQIAGPGTLTSDTTNVETDSQGRSTVTVATTTFDAAGTTTVRGAIDQADPQAGAACTQAAGTPTGAPAGACTDDVQKTWTRTGAQCNDGVDNDGDGRVDFGQDPGCADINDTTESPDPDPEAVRVASNVTIRNDRNDNAFKGAVGSSRKACQVGRTVLLKKKGRGTVGQDTTNQAGNWSVGNRGRRGRYWAIATRDTATARNGTPLICLRDRSVTIKVGRRG